MRCLFTGDDEAQAREEHAPPRALGGRWRSTESVSSRFNERCGATIDKDLADAWSFVTVPLAPAMASEHASPRSIRLAANLDGRWELLPGGQIGVTNVYDVVQDPVTRKLKQAKGDVSAIAKQFENPKVRLWHPDYRDADFQLPKSPAVTPAIEAACLKAMLVAFDIDANQDPSSWVRSEATAPARALVRETVTRIGRGEAAPNADEGRLALEVTYGFDPALAVRLRARFASRLGNLTHLLIAHGNRARRTVHATWLLFGHTAFSARLATAYDGPQFTRVLGADPTRDSHPWASSDETLEWVLPAGRGLSCWRDPTATIDWLGEFTAAIERTHGYATLTGAIAKDDGALAERIMNDHAAATMTGAALPTVLDALLHAVGRLASTDPEVDAILRTAPPGLMEGLATPVPDGQFEPQPWCFAAAPQLRSLLRLRLNRHDLPRTLALQPKVVIDELHDARTPREAP